MDLQTSEVFFRSGSGVSFDDSSSIVKTGTLSKKSDCRYVTVVCIIR
eukprot:SAG11_NODE_68_length_18649_cov_29.058005_7_plen_47_part_00